MRKIFIVAGHNSIQSGAVMFDGTTEHQHTTELQSLVLKGVQNRNTVSLEGSSMQFIVDTQKLSNARVRDLINSTSRPGSYGIDIHFNNNNPAATGTEIVIHPNTSPAMKKRAVWLVNEVSKVLDIPLRRRVRTRDYIFPSETFVGRIGIIEQTNIPMMLLEVCFGNATDMNKYYANKERVAAVIRQAMFIKIFK